VAELHWVTRRKSYFGLFLSVLKSPGVVDLLTSFHYTVEMQNILQTLNGWPV